MANVIKSALPLLIDGEEYRVTSPFGYRLDPVTGQGNGVHEGIDIVVWRGTWSDISRIGAAWDGTVTAIFDEVEGFSSERGEGNYVIVDHGGNWVSKYFHLSRGSIGVHVGQKIVAGHPIGYMGNTGYSTGAHLHFQLEQDGIPVDPAPYISGKKNIEKHDSIKWDNDPEPWSAEAIEWAKLNGIIQGDEKGNLLLHEPCTREMMCVFLHRLYKLITKEV